MNIEQRTYRQKGIEPQDKIVARTCPQCGAPLMEIGSCAYCGSQLELLTPKEQQTLPTIPTSIIKKSHTKPELLPTIEPLKGKDVKDAVNIVLMGAITTFLLGASVSLGHEFIWVDSLEMDPVPYLTAASIGLMLFGEGLSAWQLRKINDQLINIDNQS